MSWKFHPCIFAVFLWLSPLYLPAQEPYAPPPSDPVKDRWRWQLLDTLGSHNLRIAFNGEGDALVLKKPEDDRVYFYNQERNRMLARPSSVGARPYRVLFNPDGEIIMFADNGVYRHRHDAWELLAGHAFEINTSSEVKCAPDGRYWFSGVHGILEFDGERVYQHSFKDPSVSMVQSLCLGSDHALYVTVGPHGDVYRCPLIEGKLADVSAWKRIYDSKRRFVHQSSMAATRTGEVWLVNNHEHDGALVYNIGADAWTAYNLRSLGGENFSTTVMESHDGHIWVAGRGSLHIFDGGEWQVYKGPEYPIPDSQPHITQDKVGFVYLLEQGAGIRRIDYAQKHYRSLTGLHFQAEGHEGGFWYLDVDGQVIQEQRRTESRWLKFPKDQTGVEAPVALIVLNNGHVLCAGSTAEAVAFSIYNGQSWDLYRYPDFAPGLSHQGVLKLKNGDVILSCGQAEREYPDFQGGMLRVSYQDGNYVVTHHEASEATFRPWTVAEDPETGELWVGASELSKVRFGSPAETVPYISENTWVDSLATMDNRDLWMAIWGLGVFRLSEGNWENMSEDTLVSGHYYAQLISWKGGDPILATDQGIYRFDGSSWSLFAPQDVSLYRVGGTLKTSSDGSLWINTTHTDWYYRGLKREAYPAVKKSLFKTVQSLPDTGEPNTAIWGPDKSTYSTRKASIRWYGSDTWSKTLRKNLTYSYSLDGGPWSPYTTQTRLTRTDWPAGTHTLRVRARDADFNVDPAPAVHTFEIILPIWQQTWAQMTAALVVVVIFGLVTLVVRQRLRHLLELERIKLHFFTNISHELRTPLTLILGPVEKLLMEQGDVRHHSYLRTIQTNTSRLLYLIDQLLDFRRVEKGRLKSEPRRIDLVALVRNILETFDFVVKEKKQNLVFHTPFKSCTLAIDEDSFYKIVDNLIHNAIKYTPPGGTVEIRLDLPQGSEDGESIDTLELVVCDTGQGISPELKAHIFEPFYQARQKPGHLRQGVGIGLALVKELVDVLKGTIEVESPVPGKVNGTRFSVHFPVKDPGIGFSTEWEDTRVAADIAPPETSEKSETSLPAGRRAHIHLVEDHPDVLQFLRSELSEEYEVSYSEDGLAAENAILETVPDLVITDVMMPLQDGFDLCRHLKSNPVTSHVPVIMLTAFKTPHHEEEGLGLGADDYLAKPVSMRLLRLKVKNLLNRQERLREKIRLEYGLMPATTSAEIRPADKQFLDKAEAIAKDFLGEETFGAEQFAREMGMSRSNFYKKFRDLTGMSPAAYVKLRRLNESARRIEAGDGNITEIAFDVGFSDVSYFSRCFKEHFGCPPSRYVPQKTKDKSAT